MRKHHKAVLGTLTTVQARLSAAAGGNITWPLYHALRNPGWQRDSALVGGPGRLVPVWSGRKKSERGPKVLAWNRGS